MPTSPAGLGRDDDMAALLSPAEPRSDAAMTVAIRAEAALAAEAARPQQEQARARARAQQRRQARTSSS